jgi:predicted RNA methylase
MTVLVIHETKVVLDLGCGFCTTPTGTPPLSARRSLICATIDAVLAKKLP